jgi:hypothetical protein
LQARPVPQGRLKTGRYAILENLHPSLRDSNLEMEFLAHALKPKNSPNKLSGP